VEVLTLATPPTDAVNDARRLAVQDALSAGRRSSVAIGNFDGVHLGHRQVLAGCDTALTFEPHPLRVLAPERAPRLLSDRRTKLRKLEALGIRRVAIIRFDQAWSRISAHAFMEDVVIGTLGARIISVGANFRFGAGGTGSVANFADYPELHARIAPLVTEGAAGEPISSTRIRRLVTDGEVETVASLLGSPLILPARVIADSRLVIDEEFATPAPADYYGSVDGRPARIRVGDGGKIAVFAAAAQGATVSIAFLQRSS